MVTYKILHLAPSSAAALLAASRVYVHTAGAGAGAARARHSPTRAHHIRYDIESHTLTILNTSYEGTDYKVLIENLD